MTKTTKIDLSKISTDKLLDEIWLRHGEDCVIVQTYNLEHLKSYIESDERYKKGDEKEFCQYLANGSLYGYIDDTVCEMVNDFYNDKE